MMINFAPYQDSFPEDTRAAPTRSHNYPSRKSSRPSPQISHNRQYGFPPSNTHHSDNPWDKAVAPYQVYPSTPPQTPTHMQGASWLEQAQFDESQFRLSSLTAFETSLRIRLDYEAMLAYLILPPAGSVFLLLFERESDYVRFHAWQSTLLFCCTAVVHVLFFWSSLISWLMLFVDICLIWFLSVKAYRGVDTLDHYQIPIIGRLANALIDDDV